MFPRKRPSGTTVTIIAFLALGASVGTALALCEAPELVKLADPAPHSQYFFGHSVAVDGDVAVMGAYKDWSAGHEAGAVFVFRYDGSAWVLDAKLHASDAGDDDEFGASVGVSGNTIVVGANFDDDGGTDSGSAYVFRYDGSRWEQAAKLTASDAVGWDNFGYSVAIDGDVIVVGANLDDDDGGNSGSAYVFEKPAGGWSDMTETVKLTASDAGETDEFGKSVAISGEFVAVGAHLHTVGAADKCGSAYVFQDGSSGWAQVAKLTASDPSDHDRLGLSVAMDGDLVAVGAWADDDGGNQTGSVYVYEKPESGWSDMTQTAKLHASDAEAGDHFGWSVAISGVQVVVGAPAHLFDGSGFGSAYVFERPTGGWADITETARFAATDGDQDDEYGTSVAISGSIALVGSPFHKTALYYGAGASYIHGGLADCQPNGVLDACDVVVGTSVDDNGNGVPDECEAVGGGSGTVETSLFADKAAGDEITLSWEASCIATDNDYAIYEGDLGSFYTHTAKYCTTGGELQKTFLPEEGDTYYIVVPGTAVHEGSYGRDSDGTERPAAADACLSPSIAECP